MPRSAMNRPSGRLAFRSCLRLLIGFWALCWAWPGHAVPQVGIASFAVQEDAGWSDAAFGHDAAQDEFQRADDTPQFLRDATASGLTDSRLTDSSLTGMVANPRLGAGPDGFSGQISEVALVSPFLGPGRLTATCTPDPITVCREVQTAADPAPPPTGTAASGGRQGLIMISAMTVVALCVVAALGIAAWTLHARRRLAIR